jgi:hypothetical protein
MPRERWINLGQLVIEYVDETGGDAVFDVGGEALHGS